MVATDKDSITIIGCGYVGLTLAAVLANAGFTVYALEVDPKRLEVIKQGRSFFYESGADPLIAAGLASGNLIPTDSYEMAVPHSTIIFSCVGTPDNPDGSSNLTYVFTAADSALPLMKAGTVYAQKSTVPVGTGAHIEERFAASGKKILYVSAPEFSREGTAISDTLWFDRVVAGSRSPIAAERILDLHRAIQRHQTAIAKNAGLVPPKPLPEPHYITTRLSSAELIKVTANAFLALKLSFANSIAKLADAGQADILEVMDGIGLDRRIGRAFLNAGRGFGGGCFPKDVSGLIRSAENYGVGMEIMRAAMETNDSMPHYIIHKAKAALGDTVDNGVFKDKCVAVLGLSFKSGTSDVRRSPAVTIANTLAEEGALVRAYDPEAMEEAKPHLDATVTLTKDLEAAIRDTDCIFVATDWPEFIAMDLRTIAKLSGAQLIVDCMNRLDKSTLADSSLQYLGVGTR